MAAHWSDPGREADRDDFESGDLPCEDACREIRHERVVELSCPERSISSVSWSGCLRCGRKRVFRKSLFAYGRELFCSYLKFKNRC